MLLTVPVAAAGAGFVEAVTGGVGWVDMSVSGKTGKKGNGPMQDHERLPSDGSGQVFLDGDRVPVLILGEINHRKTAAGDFSYNPVATCLEALRQWCVLLICHDGYCRSDGCKTLYFRVTTRQTDRHGD